MIYEIFKIVILVKISVLAFILQQLTMRSKKYKHFVTITISKYSYSYIARLFLAEIVLTDKIIETLILGLHVTE